MLLLNAQTEGASPIEELEAELLTLGLTEDQAAGLVEAVPETTIEYVIFEAVIEEDEATDEDAAPEATAEATAEPEATEQATAEPERRLSLKPRTRSS